MPLFLRSSSFAKVFWLRDGINFVGRQKNCHLGLHSDMVSKSHLEIKVDGFLVRRRDVESAKQIQMQYLPAKSPALPCFDFAGFYRPARHIGGAWAVRQIGVSIDFGNSFKECFVPNGNGVQCHQAALNGDSCRTIEHMAQVTERFIGTHSQFDDKCMVHIRRIESI